MIDLAFPKPKDPADVAWYLLRAPEPVASVIGVTATVTDPQDLDGVGAYTTGGDALSGGPLVASSASVPSGITTTSDGKTIPAGYAIAFQLSGGVPGTSYSVRAGFVTVAGSTLYRSAVLVVTGL